MCELNVGDACGDVCYVNALAGLGCLWNIYGYIVRKKELFNMENIFSVYVFSGNIAYVIRKMT